MSHALSIGRLWLLDEVHEPVEVRYLASILWRDGRREQTPVRIKLTPGRGRYLGVAVDLEQEYDPRRVDPRNPRRLAGYMEINYYAVTDPNRFWVRHEYYQQDAEGREILKGVAQVETARSPAIVRSHAMSLKMAEIPLLPAPLPRYRLLSDEALEVA